MPEQWSVEINASGCFNQLVKAIHGHVAHFRNALRAIDDGTFEQRAKISAPNGVVQLQVMESACSSEDVARRASVSCFKEIVSEFISFLDRLIATKQIMGSGSIIVERSLTGDEEIRVYLNQKMEQKYLEVARDRKLTNPAKLAALVVSADLSSIATSFFEVRRCVEHHGGVPDADIKLRFKRIAIGIEGKEILSLPQHVNAGDAITMKVVDEEKTLRAGQRVTLTEGDIDHIAMTIQLIAKDIFVAVLP